jgi:hypothetical protein
MVALLDSGDTAAWACGRAPLCRHPRAEWLERARQRRAIGAFHWCGIDSSVLVTVSPSLRSRPIPQRRHVVGPNTITRSRGSACGIMTSGEKHRPGSTR